MFGISLSEFFVIVVVAVLFVPARMWPDVARFVARIVKFVRGIVWKITDASEKIKAQIDLEKPIDDLIKTTTDDILADFSMPRKRSKRKIDVKRVLRKKQQTTRRKK